MKKFALVAAVIAMIVGAYLIGRYHPVQSAIASPVTPRSARDIAGDVTASYVLARGSIGNGSIAGQNAADFYNTFLSGIN